MLKNIVENVNNTVTLITSLLKLVVLGGVVFGGLWFYHQVAVLTSKPIQFPKIELPKIELPEIKINVPKIDLGLNDAFKSMTKGIIPPSAEGIANNMDLSQAFGGITKEERMMYPTNFTSCRHTPKCASNEAHVEVEMNFFLPFCKHSPKCTWKSVHYWLYVQEHNETLSRLKDLDAYNKKHGIGR